MINVLVTGKDGQLGQCFKSIALVHPSINFIFKSSSELDITNESQVNEIFKTFDRLDYCINCAAYTAVDKAEEEIELSDKINYLGSKNLAIACKTFGVVLVQISTDFVFDGESIQPYTESNAANPLGVYGQSKLKGEKAIEDILDAHFIIRTSWLYSEFGNNFLKTMLRLGKERSELSVVSDQIGSPTYAIDLANVVLEFIESKNTAYGIYHYSNEGIISWYDFAKEIFKLSDNNLTLNKIETKDYPTAAVRPKYSVLSNSKLKNELGVTIPNWKSSLNNAIINLNKIEA